MKLYRVVYERGGETKREGGKTPTEIKRHEHLFAALDITALWNGIAWIREDEDCTIVIIIEESKRVTLL